MATFNEVLQQYVNLDYSDLLLTAKKSLINILPACEAVDKENKGYVMLTSVLLSALAADGKLSAKESRFLGDLLEFDSEYIDKFTDLYDSRMEEVVNAFADNLSTDLKADVITLCICVASIDETITREETAFLNKLLD